MPRNPSGDAAPDRTLALLWRAEASGPASRRGPAKSRTVDEVVAAATALADEEGIGAVTMRTVAGRVGVSPMSMYTYVPGKAELLDLMLDAAYLQMPRPAWRTRSWRRRLTAVAEANRAMLEQHPWATEVASLSRPPLGPGLMAKYEHELSAFDGTGLDDVAIDDALAFLLGFVQTHSRSAQLVARSREASGLDEAAWWAANAPVLARAFDPKTYPRAVRIGSASGEAHGSAYDPEHAWEFGLARVLDGLSALVEGHRGTTR